MKKIILVEDNKLHQEKIKDVIKEMKYKITAIYENGEKLITDLTKNNNEADLLIIDLNLKGELNGCEIVGKLNENNIEIPIIFLTAREEDIDKCMFSELNTKVFIYLTKPFQKKELQTNIELTFQKYDLYKNLKEKNKLLAGIINGIADAIMILNKKFEVLNINEETKELFSLEKEEIIGKRCFELFNMDKICEGCPVKETLINKELTELELYNEKIGKYLNIRSNPIFDDNGEISKIIIHARDITKRKERLDKIKYLSFHDSLTGLYNRRYFENELERLDTSRKLPISIIVADIVNLKYVNDNFGHKKGDEYIKRAAQLINKEVRSADILARLGGDEFALLLPETSNKDSKKLMRRFKDEFRKYNKKRNLKTKLMVSFGAATKEYDKENLNQIYEKADNNMYKDKRNIYEKALS